MAITKVGSDVTATVTNGSTDNVSLPSGLQQNDIVVVALASDSDIDPARPRGIASSEGYTDILHTTSGTPGTQVAWKRMGATPDTTVEVRTETGSALDIAVVIQAWRGVDTTTAIDATAATASGTSGLPNPPSYTTVTNNALRIITGGIDDDQVTDFTAPSGYSNMVSLAIGVSNTGCSVVMASKIQATAGAEDPAAFTGTGSDNWQATHFALRPASASNPTLTASGGTYTETGTAATLKRSRLFSCESVSYTETGTAASLERGYPITASSGTFTETGSSATLRKTNTLSIGSGVYTETGTDAVLGKGLLFSLEETSYSFTGNASSLEKGYVLSIGAGSYTETGSNATLTYAPNGGYVLSLDSTTFTETGSSVTLKTARTLSLASRSFVETGKQLAAYPTPSPGDAWDYTTASSGTGDINLTNSNKTATREPDASFPDVRSTNAHANGKRYVEVTMDGDVSDFVVGPYDTVGGEGLFLYASGAVENNGQPFGAIVAGDVIGIAYAADAGQVWFRVNNGDWNGNSPSNPSTIIGGFTVTANSSLPIWVEFGDSSTATINTGPSFTNSIPTGYVGWHADISLSIDNGAYTYTGSSASLKYGRVFSTESGTFTETGSDVTLTYSTGLGGPSLSLEEGVISYIPGLVEVLRGYSVSNEGSYTTTGTDATFNRTFVITNDNGSFTETGSDASLKYGKYFLAGDASYAETGSDATFTYRQEIASEEGSFIVSGSSVTYRRTYIFDVSGNSFGLTGKNLILTIPPFPSSTTTVSRTIYETTTETGSLFEETSAIPVETLYGTSTEAGTLYETSADPDPQEIIYGETAG